MPVQPMDDHQGEHDEQSHHDDEGQHPPILAVLVCQGGVPVSSCCRAEVYRSVDYTDTAVSVLADCETSEDGVVSAAYYRYVKSYDGIDGENERVYCSGCEADIDVEGVALDEG